MTATKAPRLRSWVKWHGGKGRLLRQFLPLFKPHFGRRCFADLTFGGGAIPLNLPRFEVEFWNDLDRDLIRALQTIQANPWKLLETLNGVRYTRENFDGAKRLIGDPDDLAHAAGFIVRNRFSMGGRGDAFSWSDRPRGGLPEGVNSWKTYREVQFPRIVERAQHAIIVQGCAIARLRTLAGDWLVYLDPPYVPETRACPDVYSHEMSVANHMDLLDAAVDASGRGVKLFISGYFTPLYDNALSGWTRHEFTVANNAASGKTKAKKTECIWESP